MFALAGVCVGVRGGEGFLPSAARLISSVGFELIAPNLKSCLIAGLPPGWNGYRACFDS